VTSRHSVALIAALGLLCLPLLPPEHMHVSESEEHGHSEVVHRHFEPHHPIEVSHPAGRAPEFDHQDEEAALWLDAPYLGPASIQVPPAHDVVVGELPRLEPRRLSRWTLTFKHNSVHDPPWIASTGLRAPPTFLV
jgi:hypothetical protein